ncbi:hypothetical protein [Methylobacterium nigriterrae]
MTMPGDSEDERGGGTVARRARIRDHVRAVLRKLSAGAAGKP